MQKFKIGDAVIVKDKSFRGKMDYWRGKIIKIEGILVTIKDIDKSSSYKGSNFTRRFEYLELSRVKY